MCKALLNLFKKNKLPHPEESRLTTPVTDITAVREKWMKVYRVPVAYLEYWRGVKITLDDSVPFAWCSSEEIRINPYWANPGVLAHEAAHRSYSFLNKDEKSAFAVEHERQKVNSPMVRLLYSINQYGLSSPIEGHGECYRYLCTDMPKSLQLYYPKLL